MAEGRLDDEWNHTSHVLAMLANTVRDPKTKPKPFEPREFNPREREQAGPAKAPPKVGVGVLTCFLPKEAREKVKRDRQDGRSK